jgi:hypothetical protein
MSLIGIIAGGKVLLFNRNLASGPPHDTEKAFDTGSVFYNVFALMNKGRLVKIA